VVRDTGPPDPYEGAAARLEATRRAREENRDAVPDVAAGVRPAFVPRVPTRWLVLPFVGFVLVGVNLTLTAPRDPQLPADCKRASLKVLPESTATGQPVGWTATGPEGRYVVTVGVTALRLSAAGAPVIDRVDKGNEADATIEGETTMGGCRAGGRFLLRQGQGVQYVRLFRVEGDRARVVATAEVDSQGRR